MKGRLSMTWCGACGQTYPCAFAVACAVPVTGLRGPFVRREHYDRMRCARLGTLLKARGMGLPLRLPTHALTEPPHSSWPPRTWQAAQ